MEDYKNKILEISKRLNKAQKPIRILNAIKWDNALTQHILDNKLKNIPEVGPEYYAQNSLGFAPIKKVLELEEIRRDIGRYFDESDPLGHILERNCRQYEEVVRLLLSRGKREFYQHSVKLFGSTQDYFSDGVSKVADLGHVLEQIINGLKSSDLGEVYKKQFGADDVVKKLSKSLRTYFHGTSIRVKKDDGILSDASAGSDYIKIKSDALFSLKDMEILEVHEGHVHLGTTINGKLQTHAQWLAKGPPCATIIQEGIAVLMEVLTFASLPDRVKKINDRLLACEMAEQGASLEKVCAFYKDMGHSDFDALNNALRVFRGGLTQGGAPFTKDISYCVGFVKVYNFVRTNVALGMPEVLPFLFAGKVTLEDVPVLYEYWQKGVIDYPRYLPLRFSDLNGITVWMAFSNFLNKMNLGKISQKYQENL